MGISLSSVISYLYTQVGEGKITRSDILFSISKETREAVDEIRRRRGYDFDLRFVFRGPQRDEALLYSFGHLRDIFEARWELFSKTLPRGPASDRRQFLSGMARLNSIRNRVMHPAKGLAPTEEDFRFVREFILFAQIADWGEQESSD